MNANSGYGSTPAANGGYGSGMTAGNGGYASIGMSTNSGSGYGSKAVNSGGIGGMPSSYASLSGGAIPVPKYGGANTGNSGSKSFGGAGYGPMGANGMSSNTPSNTPQMYLISNPTPNTQAVNSLKRSPQMATTELPCADDQSSGANTYGGQPMPTNENMAKAKQIATMLSMLDNMND